MSDEKNTKIDLTKKLNNSQASISLKKRTLNLDKTLISLSKSSGIDLKGHRAKVAVDLDFSGSMKGLYASGKVQEAMSRLFPIALRFDDNGELDTWIFETGFHRLDAMNTDNHENYVKDCIIKKRYVYGGTNYAPVLQDNLQFYFNSEEKPTKDKQKSYGILSKIFKKKHEQEHEQIATLPKEENTMPVFVIFLTDGDNWDSEETDAIIRESAKKNIFIQFVGIGNSSFNYLKKLDDLKDRDCDNTGFIEVSSFDSLTDDELYSKLLEQYVQWLNVKGLK